MDILHRSDRIVIFEDKSKNLLLEDVFALYDEAIKIYKANACLESVHQVKEIVKSLKNSNQ